MIEIMDVMTPHGGPHPSRTKPSPKADGVEDALRSWLVRRRPRRGDRLPPDTELARMMGVARGTLRTALQRLEDSGHIVRRQGSGTFVLRPPGDGAMPDGLEVLETYQQMADRQGRELRVSEVEVARGGAVGPRAAAALGLADGDRATVIRRTVEIDGQPSMRMTDVVHPRIVLPRPAGLRRRLQRDGNLLDIVTEAGEDVAYVTTSITARTVTPREDTGTGP